MSKKRTPSRPKRRPSASLLDRIPASSQPKSRTISQTLERPDRTGSRQPLPAVSRSTLTQTGAPFFVRLGDGQAGQLGVGNKGALLDRAAYAGLPVPGGVILLDPVFDAAEHAGFIRISGRQVLVTNAAKLLSLLRLPPFRRPLAVRSAFSAEDGLDQSLAGYFTSKLFVDPTDPAQLAAALADVWSSALRREGAFRRDVLIMEMVEAEQAGVLFTEPEYEDDLINYTAGTAEALVGGQIAGQTMHLPKLHPWGQPAPSRPPFAPRLQKLLSHIRREFGPEAWDIEWADDGRYCWLVQLRPITRPVRRNEAFTVANMKEILPELPSRFMSSLIASCAGQLFAYYRQFDPGLPRQRPIIEVFYGRPYFNISLLTEMMRRWGLPTRLVTGNIGGEADREVGFQPVRFLSKTTVLLRVGWAQLTSVSSAQRAIKSILAKTEQPGHSLADCIETLRWLFATLVTEMFSLTSAMSGPLLLLRRAGVLAEHNARQQTIATQMYTDLERLRAMAAANEALHDDLRAGQLPPDEAFRLAWQAYLDKHGHRGVYESDIARPRLHEAPEATLRSLLQPPRPPQTPPRRTVKGWLTLPVWWQAGRAMRARELLRYHAILGFDRIRRQIVTLAQSFVEQGHLPDVDAIWQMDIDEVRRLEQGWLPADDFFANRQAEIARLKKYQLPDLFHRFDDLEKYRAGAADARPDSRLSGLSLTTGTVTGQAWVLTEPALELPSGFDSAKTILVARSVDAGWIPTFGQVAGVVVEIGGDLSHGSIILREIGLPAITNVRGATRAVQTGDSLILHAERGLVEKN